MERNQCTRQLGGTRIWNSHLYQSAIRFPAQQPATSAFARGQSGRRLSARHRDSLNWDGRDIYLRLEGAKSGVYVYLNGKEVGYSEDSKNPAEFLINKYLQPGKNSLVVKCFRYSTGSYLECQDFWRLSGIERDVFLFSQPKTAVQDFEVVSTLDDTYKNGIFKLDVNVTNHTAANKNVTVTYELLDADKKVVTSAETPCNVSADGKNTVTFNASLNNVKTWTSEQPNLYKLLISLKKMEK